MENMNILCVLSKYSGRIRKIFIYLIIFTFLISKTNQKHIKFEYLDIQDQKTQIKLFQSVFKIQNASQEEISVFNSTNLIQIQEKAKYIIMKIKSNSSLEQKDCALLIFLIYLDETLTSMVFQNFKTREMLKIFKYFDSSQVKKQFLFLILQNQSLSYNFFSQASYLDLSQNRKNFLEYIFSKNNSEINQILLKNIDLSLLKNQRCVLSKFPVIKYLRDQQQYKLSQQQKEMLIPILIKQDSLCVFILKDGK